MKKIAVVLSGCGNKDGSEIQEAVSLIVSLSQLGAQLSFFAPDYDFTAKNFLTNKPLEKRNVMVESARISRSKIQDLKNLKADSFDGLAMPGGFGAALNLSDWAEKGSQCRINEDLEKAILDFHQQSKPIAAICIAPTIVARVLGPQGVSVTIGDDKETAEKIKKTGAHHENCPVDDFITDREHKVITTPAYMYGEALPHQVFKGIQGLARELMEMA
jgi:enhancing lycopene biosynthesis protein 2